MTGSDLLTVRVVSLVPSITETLLAWGVDPIAVTRFCEAPGIATIGGTKNPDVAAVVALGPDVVLLDEQENCREDHDALLAAGLRVHVTDVRSVADVAPALEGISAAVGRTGVDVEYLPAGGQLVPPARLRAFVPIWRRPWMSINRHTYGSSILEAAGIDNVCAEATEAYPEVTLEAVRDLRPDVVLAPSEPYPWKDRHRPELEQVGPVRFVDGQDVFWWGARTGGALARLQELAATLAPG